jgi:hypothetical protein
MTDREPPDQRRPRRGEREERMRYEVLLMLHRAARGSGENAVNAWGFAQDLGVWHAELFRVVEFLERKGLVEYLGAGPVIRITAAGIDFVEAAPDRRRVPG